MDEVDAIFNSRKADSNEDLRGILNSGYRRGAYVGRAAVVGKGVVTEEWPSFAPVALAGLGNLPDTLMTRSVIIRMKRRRSGERVEPYRERVERAVAEALREELADWCESIREVLGSNYPELPEGIEDRDADIWEPLIAIADAAGGEWPSRGRGAAVFLTEESHARPVTLGVRLLADIRVVLAGRDRISSAELVEGLRTLEGAPWDSLKGEPLDTRGLARMLDKYDVKPTKIRLGSITVQGYTLAGFWDAFERYAPHVTLPDPEQPEQPEHIAPGTAPRSGTAGTGGTVAAA
ncbi:DUF3631 domain-containing protein [Microbacterium sp. ASV81]|uniref:DUF3631 domain-containing protein n=2 Tax=Microbacterium capsulatum TaxID=3041921 RepID=A0ABU0XEY9_9MICO|nr:DUF3631 domain-containing protein [Microbacterium sp. ASV81]MDQ4213274.1 DUF3631 domain-containing protein [Microbacterium sp. ASV81]